MKFKKISLETFRDISAFGNPFILIIIILVILGINELFWKIIFGLIILEIFCSILKIVFYKDRPKKEKYTNLLEKIDSGSFPSLHTARSSFIFLILLFLPSTNIIKTLSIFLIISIGLSRIILKKHHLSDVLIGFLIGLIFSLIWIKVII
jgi:membrane-associated phospholipid phosphatase